LLTLNTVLDVVIIVCCRVRVRSFAIGGTGVGLSWQQGPLSPEAIGPFLVPERLPTRLLYVESGFASRRHLLRSDVDPSALTAVTHQTFCRRRRGPCCCGAAGGNALMI
jgi:hypothetical protein